MLYNTLRTSMQTELSSPFPYKRWQNFYNKLSGDKTPYLEPTTTNQNKSKSTLDWGDMVYRYDNDKDIFRLFFIKTTEEMVKEKKELATNVRMSVDTDGKMLYFEFENASKTFGCHLLDYPHILDEWPGCSLHWSYDHDEDALDIHLMSEAEVKRRFHHNQQAKEPFQYDIIFDMDKNDRYISCEINSASKLLRKKNL